MSTTLPTLSNALNDEQRARVAAAGAARELLRGTEGFAKSAAPSMEDLIHLTHFLLTGTVDPAVFLPESRLLEVRPEPAGLDPESDAPWWVTVLAIKIDEPDGDHYFDRLPGPDGGFIWRHRGNGTNWDFSELAGWMTRPNVVVTETDPLPF